MSRQQLLSRLVAVVAIVLVLLVVDFTELWRTLSSITFSMVLSLMLLAFFMVWVSAYKWRLLLIAQLENKSEAPSVLRLFSLYLMGYFVNLIVPSYVGGDVVRSAKLGKHVGQYQAAAATVLERYTGFVAMVVLALAFIWIVPGRTELMVGLVALIALSLSTVTALALSPFQQIIERYAPERLAIYLTTPLEKIHKALEAAKDDPRSLTMAFALSFLFHGLTIVNTALAGIAIGWSDPHIAQLFVVVPIILLLSAIPITPQGLGIQEGAFVYFLPFAGASPAQALAVAVVLRAKSYLLALIGGGVYWFDRNR